MMEGRTISFEQRLKENIKNYSVRNLLPLEMIKAYFEILNQEFGLETLLTDRHGLHEVTYGDFSQYHPDVVEEPGIKIRVENRTIGHLYARYDKVSDGKKPAVERFLDHGIDWMSDLGKKVFLQKETSSYMEELEMKLNQEKQQSKYREKEDALTGVYNKSYLENRMSVLDRAEVAPVAVINANINDWKFVYDHYGIDESDSLIQLAASILMKEAKPEYIIGRIGGDDFLVLIPLAMDKEAEDYCARVQGECAGYEDGILAPSIAMGISYKTNVEERLKEIFSDAEYEMFNNKLELKNMPGYQERLQKGLKNNK